MRRTLKRVRTAVFLLCLAVFGTGCTWVVPEGARWTFQPKHGDTVRVVMSPSFGEPEGPETVQRCWDAGGEFYWSPQALQEWCEFYP